MNRVDVKLPDYLRPPCAGLWRWQDNGDAIAWTTKEDSQSGPTAGLAAQLRLILQMVHDSVGGLPPMTCILEVIAACEDRSPVALAVDRMITLAGATGRGGRRLDPQSRQAIQLSKWAGSVRALPKEMRSGFEAQADLVSMAFDSARPYLLESTGDDAADVIECLSIAAADRDLRWSSEANERSSPHRAKRAFEALVRLSSKPVDVGAFGLWRRARVSSMPEPLDDVQSPPKDPVGQTLNELSHDDDWQHVARSARSMSSLLSLPRHPSDPVEMPCGGVSDVANRGQPERLLMTELAQDSMVMLARIANGQALYLRRESPPGPSPKTRPVLLETGIRTWGNVRLRIASVGLAIAALEERRGDGNAEIMAVGGDHWVREDFGNTDGVIKHLERLDPSEHPGRAIAGWLKEKKVRSAGEGECAESDPVLVISAASDRDPEFRSSLTEMPPNTVIVRVEDDLSITMLVRTPLGDQVKQVVAPEAVVGGDSDDASSLRRTRTKDSSIALFLDVHPCPLRFTDHLDGAWILPTETHGVWVISRDRMLLLFDRSKVGAVCVAETLPPGHVLAHEYDDRTLKLVLGEPSTDHVLVAVDLRTRRVRRKVLESPRSTKATYVFDQGSLFRFSSGIEAIDASTGNVSATAPLAGWRHIGGPVIGRGFDIRIIDTQGAQIVMHEMGQPVAPPRMASGALRRRRGEIVLFAADQNVIVYLRDQPESVPLTQRPDVRQTWKVNPVVRFRSADDQKIIFDSGATKENPCLVDLDDHTIGGLIESTPRDCLWATDPKLRAFIASKSLLSRIDAVSVDWSSQIVLHKRRRRWAITPDVESPGLRLESQSVWLSEAPAISLHSNRQAFRGAESARWQIRACKMGKHTVMADSRGLLHLRSGDDDSELTLVLHIGPISGWASWGERFGDVYFLGDPTCPPSPRILQWLREFGASCKRSN